MKIGLDLDGVLYDWHKALYNEMVLYEGITVDYRTFWLEIVPKYSSMKAHNLTSLEHLYSNMPPTKELVDYVNYLCKKYDVFYLTSRPDCVKFTTRASMERWGFANLDKLYLVNGGKRDVVLREKPDVFVDDRDKVIEELCDIVKVVVVAHPWNEKYQNVFPTIRNIMELESVL
jgi:hypothetical protein